MILQPPHEHRSIGFRRIKSGAELRSRLLDAQHGLAGKRGCVSHTPVGRDSLLFVVLDASFAHVLILYSYYVYYVTWFHSGCRPMAAQIRPSVRLCREGVACASHAEDQRRAKRILLGKFGAPFSPGFPMSGLGPQTNMRSKNTCLTLFVLGKTPHDETPRWGDPEKFTSLDFDASLAQPSSEFRRLRRSPQFSATLPGQLAKGKAVSAILHETSAESARRSTRLLARELFPDRDAYRSRSLD